MLRSHFGWRTCSAAAFYSRSRSLQIQSLRTAFTLNTALKQLFLSSTGLTSAGAIALAEFLPESSALLTLGLTDNALDLAGALALAGALKRNHVMRCLDLSVPPGDEDIAKFVPFRVCVVSRMLMARRACRDIFNTCVRNTEEAEAATRARAEREGSPAPVDGKAVWGMIEKSQLAKSIRRDDAKKVRLLATLLSAAGRGDARCAQNAKDLPGQVRAYLAEMASRLATVPAPAGRPLPDVDSQLAARAGELADALTAVIERSTEPDQLEELLGLHDTLAEARAARYLAKPRPPRAGLGLNLADLTPRGGGALVASALGTESPGLLTPRGSVKGKARAEPEPEPFEQVTTPTFVLASDDEDDERTHGLAFVDAEDALPEGEDEEGADQTTRSRSWVEEEGEVFRKGTRLLGPEEMEGDYDGDELRVEVRATLIPAVTAAELTCQLLETEVERPPPRAILDEHGLEVLAPGAPEPASVPMPASPADVKPAPRPYIPRRRSSQASLTSVSSTGSTHTASMHTPEPIPEA
jgi:protein phosphatase 1 regulatory subunit 37